MRPPALKGKGNEADSTQLINPFSLNQAILIGLSSEIPGLSAPIQKIQQSLQEPGGLFPALDIHSLTDLSKSGNRTMLVHRLNALAEGSKVQPFENLVLYFVGHAEKKPSYKLLIPERIFTSDTKPEERDWQDWATFRDWIAPIRTKNLLIVLDTCYASALNTKETLRWLRDLDAKEPGQKLLFASGSEDPREWEREWTCFFTQAFVDGLSGWSARNDYGTIDVDTLFKFMLKRVPVIAKEKTGKPDVKPYPFRVSWPEHAPFPMELTNELERNALDEPLKNALLEGRCLLWVGENLKNRSTPQEFPPRIEWDASQRDLWLDYVDSQRAPGVASMQVASFGLSMLDSGIDTSVLKACRKKHYQFWVPLPGTHPPSDALLNIRLAGEPNTDHFAYEWEDLDYRFQFFLDWLARTRRFDTVLLMGFPFEELAARNWLLALTQHIPNIWLSFPYDEGHDRAYWFNEIGIKLIFAQDADVLRLLKEVTRVGVRRERTALVRTAFPRKKRQKGRDVASTPNPYRGLMPFGEMHYDIFYGRLHTDGLEGPLQTLRDDVLHNQKVLLFGESGCGKTSMLQAGLLPVLQEVDGFRVFYSDALDPLEDLAQKVGSEACFLEPPNTQNVLERLGFLSKQTGRPVLICIDHIERGIIRSPDHNARQNQTGGILERLEQAVKQLEHNWPTGDWRLLISIRKDAYIHLRSFIQSREGHRTRAIFHRELFMLDEAAAREAISQPIPEPFRIQDELVERLLIDLRTWNPGHPPTYNPFWIQIVCRQLFEKAREAGLKKNGEPVMSLSHYKAIEGGFSAWLRNWVYQQTIGKLSTKARVAAKDILSLMLTAETTRRHRTWGELLGFLKEYYEEDVLTEAKEALLNQQILRERRIVQGPPQLELTHDVLIDAVKPLCTEDLSLASYIMGHIQQIDGPSVPALPAKTVRHMNQRTGYLDRIPDNHRGGVMHLKDESIRYHRNRLILQASLAVVLVVGVLLGWIYLPRSLESKVDQRIATMLQDKSKEQKSMWSAVKFFQSDQALGIARRKLSIHLLQHKGKDACKLLLALYHTTRGRVGESVRIATKRKGAFSLKALDCPDNVQLKRIELRGANLDGATLKRADFMGSSLQELSLVGANLQGSRLFSANMLKANLSKANLRNANLEGTQLQYSKLNGADLRGAKIQHGAFLGASLKGTLFSSNQVKQLGETGANIQGAACLSSKPGAGFVNGAAEACYKWHLSPGPAAARPPGCPLLLRGPIFAFPVLARPGQCPTDIRNQLDQYTAYCPTGNKVACAIGKKCRNGDAKSCLTLATMYHKGEGVTKKPSVAIILYRRSCIGKEAAACYALGQMYEKGHGTKRNAQKALSLFKQACQANHGTACEQLGRTFEQGIDGKVDITQAQSFYKTACDKQKPFSCYRLGRIYSIGKEVPRNPREAADYYQKACDQNHSYGCFWLGVDQLTRQRSRRAGNKTLQKAMPLLDAQCKNRDAASCAFLGKMYEKGYGTRKRSRKAFALYRKACDGRDAMGCNGVGEGYYFGRGTRKRRRRAARYYREGCRYGSGLACNNIGAMYERGKGLRRSARRAFSFYKQSCKLYYGWGCNDLAELYYTGKGVKRDRDTAKTYYKKACSLGVRDACK